MSYYSAKTGVVNLFYDYEGETKETRAANIRFENGYITCLEEIEEVVTKFGFGDTRVLKIFTNACEDLIVDVPMNENMSVYDFELLHGLTILDTLYTRALSRKCVFELPEGVAEDIAKKLKELYEPRILFFEQQFEPSGARYFSFSPDISRGSALRLTSFESAEDYFCSIFAKVEFLFWENYEKMIGMESKINTIQEHEIEPMSAFNDFNKEYNFREKIRKNIIQNLPAGIFTNIIHDKRTVNNHGVIYTHKNVLKNIRLPYIETDCREHDNNELRQAVMAATLAITQDGMLDDYMMAIKKFFGGKMAECFAYPKFFRAVNK